MLKAFFGFLIFSSCLAITKPSLDQYINLNGKWEWTKTTTHSRAGMQRITPESCKCTKSIEFISENSYRLITQSEQNIYQYHLDTINILNDPERIHFVSEFFKGDMTIKDNNLKISLANVDGPAHHFKRVID